MFLKQQENAMLHVGGGVRKQSEQSAGVRTRTYKCREISCESLLACKEKTQKNKDFEVECQKNIESVMFKIIIK